jgi:hypothetical protein
MLQGSSDGDPAAPAGFAEALSVTRNEKSTLRGAFFMPGIHHAPHHETNVGVSLLTIAVYQPPPASNDK